MKREFVSTSTFDKLWAAMGLGDEDRRKLERILLENPHTGVVIPGTAVQENCA